MPPCPAAVAAFSLIDVPATVGLRLGLDSGPVTGSNACQYSLSSFATEQAGAEEGRGQRGGSEGADTYHRQPLGGSRSDIDRHQDAAAVGESTRAREGGAGGLTQAVKVGDPRLVAVGLSVATGESSHHSHLLAQPLSEELLAERQRHVEPDRGWPAAVN